VCGRAAKLTGGGGEIAREAAAVIECALNRCLALADKITRELSKKKPEDFPSTLLLADFQASLERVAEVLEDHPPKK
jgi:hypothetical protein